MLRGMLPIVVAAASFNSWVDTQPAFPQLPTTFSTLVEATFVDRKSTRTIREHYDYPGNRLHLMTMHDDDYSETILDFNSSLRYHHNTTSCQIYKIPENGTIGASNGHVMSPSNFLRTNFAKIYTGEKVVRGIPCNSWRENVTNDTLMGTHHSFVLDYFFAIEQHASSSSSSARGNRLQMPVQARILFVVSTSRRLE